MNCPNCGQDDGTVERRAINTMYQNEESNYLISCKQCFDEAWNYYQELWDEIESDQRASCNDALRCLYLGE